MRSTERHSCTTLGSLIIAAVFLVAGAGCVSGKGNEQTACHPVVHQYDPAIEPYVSFLQTQNTGPVDYIMRLFEKYDVVILCERWHVEVTQYDMIYQLVSDPRFIREVGVLFTEVGSVSLQSYLDELMGAHDLSQEEVTQRAVHIMRNACYGAYWQKRNFYDLLVKLHALNRELAKDNKQIQWHFTDVPWSWDGATTDDYVAMRQLELKRDLLEAECVIQERRRRLAAGEPTKCLVIMNYRHAFLKHLRLRNGELLGDTGAYILEAFPNETACVLINQPTITGARSLNDLDIDLVHGGTWDAAFEALGNPDLGFDFEGSPFGVALFDLVPADRAPEISALPYQDIFTGFVFYKPLRDFRNIFGAPGLIDESFLETVRQRCELTEGTEFPFDYTSIETEARTLMKRDQVVWKTVEELIPGYQGKIDRWLVDEEASLAAH